MKQGVLIALLFVAFAVVQTEAYFRVASTCNTLRNDETVSGGPPLEKDKRTACIDCWNKTLTKPDDEELSPEAKKCMDFLPDKLKRCGEQEKDQCNCLQKNYRGHMIAISKVYWTTWTKTASAEQRGCARQFIGFLFLLHDFKTAKPDDFLKINETIAECRAKFLDQVRNKRQAEEENKVSSEKYLSEKDEMEEGDRLLKKLNILCDYLNCKITALKDDPVAFGHLKEFIKTYPGNIPAKVVAVWFPDCLKA